MSDFNRSRGCGAPLFTTAASDCPCESAQARRPAASLALSGSTETTRSCGCQTARSCGCQSDSVQSNSNDDACGCCKASMREALKLLCSNQISDLVDFDGFAFVTDDLLVGARPVAMCPTAKDNLSDLCGTFRRFSPCNCDLIDISGTAYGAFGTLVDVDQATLCSLSALVFQVEGANTSAASGGAAASANSTGCGCDPTSEGRYRRVRDLLQCQLSDIDRACGECICHCDCTDDCCCASGVLAALSSLSLNKRATLVAGLLALRNVTVIGTIGNVLVLGNDEDYRFYFVCANKVEMLA